MANDHVTTIHFLTPVQSLLPQVEELMYAQSEGHDPDLGAAFRHLLSSGGKRVRPVVALLAGGMLGGETERLVILAAAIELLHTATLVHDDLIDGAYLRRGIATINSQWSPAATVLTGDFIFARAAKLAAATDSVQVMNLFAQTLATIVNGEISQLFADRRQVGRDTYYERIYAKTASMFELATAAAALLSPVRPEVVNQAQTFGCQIGMAFQIVDDVLDFTAEQSDIGKPVASDLRQGLFTLPTLYYRDAHPGDPDLEAILSGNHLAESRMNRLIDAIRESGAIERSMEEAGRFVDQALEILEHMPDCPERQALKDLTYYIIRRQS